MKDPLGTFITELRADAALTAVVGQRISANHLTPPSVRLRAGPTTMTPFGPNSGRVGVQGWQGVARCYGGDQEDPNGSLTARQVAGLVVDAVHGIGAVRGSTFIIRAWAPAISDLLRDPDTGWVYHDVRIEAYAAAQAVTV